MKKLFKWLLILCGVCIVLAAAAVLIVPRMIDMEKYRPRIESLVSEKANRPFSLKGDIDLSLFPWLGVGLSDLHLGNPDGFSQKDMLAVEKFEVRIKVMPLLSRRIEVKTFMIDRPVIYLEKLKNGTANWEGIGAGTKPEKAAGKKEDAAKKTPAESGQALPIDSLLVGSFGMTGGQITYVDQTRNTKNEIRDLEFLLTDISLDKPVTMAFKARVDGRPVSLDGRFGPVGKDPGKGTVSLDLAARAMKELALTIKGNISQPAVKPAFDLSLSLAPFSLRRLMAELAMDFPVTTTDPGVFEEVAAGFRITGTPAAVAVSDGMVTLDDSRVTVDLAATEFDKPDLRFTIAVDRIDLDRYLPPGQEKSATDGEPEKSPAGKTDYTPLRKLVLDGMVRVKKLTARGMDMDDIRVKVTAKDGVFTMDPCSLRIAGGVMNTTARVDVSRKRPATEIGFKMAEVQAAPLIQALAEKDIIEGTLNTRVRLQMAGDTPETITETLTGDGSMVFTDGAVVGVDLTNVMTTITSRMGVQAGDEKKPRTDFAEFSIPFDIKNGVFSTTATSLVSPLLRVAAKGKADLVQRTLDFKITPKVVGTLKGQGDQKDRSGVMVPVNVTGTFTSPKFRPDLEGILNQDLPDAAGLKSVLKDKDAQKEKLDEVKKEAQSLIQGLVPAQ